MRIRMCRDDVRVGARAAPPARARVGRCDGSRHPAIRGPRHPARRCLRGIPVTALLSPYRCVLVGDCRSDPVRVGPCPQSDRRSNGRCSRRCSRCSRCSLQPQVCHRRRDDRGSWGGMMDRIGGEARARTGSARALTGSIPTISESRPSRAQRPGHCCGTGGGSAGAGAGPAASRRPVTVTKPRPKTKQAATTAIRPQSHRPGPTLSRSAGPGEPDPAGRTRQSRRGPRGRGAGPRCAACP